MRVWPGVRPTSLRRTLILVLLCGLLLASGVAVWTAWLTAADATDAAYDRALAGAIKAIDDNISSVSGGLSVELPYVMLEFFELTVNGKVYFRVATEDGLVEIGNTDLPAPNHSLPSERLWFSDAVYHGERIRLGSYARLLNPPLAGHEDKPRVVIQVAESLDARESFLRLLMLQAGLRHAGVTALALALIALGTGWALRPLMRLSTEVRHRSPTDLTPIAEDRLPTEVQPLVRAMNHHMWRHHKATEGRRRFIDDASHQLRTPLTTLATQVAYALRETPPGPAHEAMTAVRQQVETATRQLNQMLSLARADSAELRAETFDLVPMARELTRQWWPRARAARIGLGFEALGDAQLRRFKADPANKGKIMDRGLWSWTRHPNYFGDATVWWGLFLVSAEAWPGILTVLSPLAMTYFLVFRTGARLLEKEMAKRPGYREYMERTSGFFPLPPRRRKGFPSCKPGFAVFWHRSSRRSRRISRPIRNVLSRIAAG